MNTPGKNGTNDAGGLGDGSGSNYRTTARSNSPERLLQRAVRAGWRIPSRVKVEAVETLHRMISDPDLTARQKIAAIRALASISKAECDSIRTTVFITRGAPDPVVERAVEAGKTLQEWLRETHELSALEEAENGQSDDE
jgi:hypothetical protein